MVSQASGGAVRGALDPGRRDPGTAPGLPTALRRGPNGGCALSPAAAEELLFPLGKSIESETPSFTAEKSFDAERAGGLGDSPYECDHPSMHGGQGGHPVPCFVTAPLLL